MTKKLRLSVRLVALVACAMLSAQCTNQQPAGNAATDSTETIKNPELKLAYVQIDSLLSQYNLSKDLNESMLSKEENARAALNKKGKELQGQVTEFQRKLQNNAFISEDRARQEQERLGRLQEDLQEMQTRLAGELDAESKKNAEQLRDSLRNFLNIYVKKTPYTMILSNSGMESLLYAHPSYDITQEVVKGLNARYKKKDK